MARMFVQMKLLEVKRFSAGPAAEATQKFTEFQKQIEAATKRLVELKSGVTRRKRAALMRAAEARVAEAEGLVERMKEAASIFADDGKCLDGGVDVNLFALAAAGAVVSAISSTCCDTYSSSDPLVMAGAKMDTEPEIPIRVRVTPPPPSSPDGGVAPEYDINSTPPGRGDV